MQGDMRKSLNTTGECRVITIDDLEEHFVEPFTDPESRQRRSELCAGFRTWLIKVKDFGVPLDIWINGHFATFEALPKHVDVVCVMHYFKKPLYGKDWSEFSFFIQKRNGQIQKEYNCSVELAVLNFDHIKNYPDSLFGNFQHYANDGIFKIIL